MTFEKQNQPKRNKKTARAKLNIQKDGEYTRTNFSRKVEKKFSTYLVENANFLMFTTDIRLFFNKLDTLNFYVTYFTGRKITVYYTAFPKYSSTCKSANCSKQPLLFGICLKRPTFINTTILSTF